MNLASSRRNWPTGRGFERFYGFLGAETNQWYPGAGLRQPPRRPAAHARGGLPPERGPHRQGAGVHQGRQGAGAGQAVLPLLRAGRLPRPAPRAEGVDRPLQGPLRHGLRGDARADARPPEGDGHRPARHRAAAAEPDRHARDPHRARTASRSRRWTTRARGTRCRPRSSGCSAAWPRSTPASWRTPTRRSGGCWTTSRRRGQRENTMVIVVSDNGASGEGGPNGSVNENKFFNGIPDDIDENLAMLDELGGPKTYNHYPNGWAMAFNTPFKMWKRYEFNGGTSDPCIISWPKGIEAHGRDPRAVPPRHRPRPDDPRRARRRAARDHRRPRPEPLRRRQHALQLRRRAAAQRARDAVLLDARLAQHLARRLEGRHHPPDAQRLEQLRQGHLGALPHRRRPLRAARPRRRRSPSACRR